MYRSILLLIYIINFTYGNVKCQNINSFNSEKISLENDLIIGAYDSDPILGGWPLKTEVGPEGQIFVADPQSYSVKVFSNKGKYIRKIGQKGRGPGEFGYLRSIGINNKRLYVMDSNDRISVFDTESYELIRDIKVPHFSTQWAPHDMKVTSEGFIIIYKKSFVVGENNIEEIEKLSLINKQGDFINKNFNYIKADQLFVMNSGSSIWRVAMPFGGKSYVETSDNTFYYGWSENAEIIKTNPDGNSKDTVRFSYKPVNITDEDVELVLEYPSNSFRGKALRNAEMPKSYPVYDWFIVDDKKKIWLATNTVNRKNYSLKIIDNKRIISEVPLLKSIKLQVIKRGYAYGIKRDENGSQLVVRFEIINSKNESN